MKNKTDITIILDRSGSMDSVKTDTIGGFNSFLSSQQQSETEAALSLVQFDDQYETLYIDRDIRQADKLTDRTFEPRGMTALFDAIGRTIVSVGQRLANLNQSERPDKVLMVIMTDGLENASKEFSAEKISEMIQHQRNIYNWEFMFIGANQDAVLSAKAIGIATAASITYAANSEGTNLAFAQMASKISAYRSSNDAVALEFNDQDREEQFKAGAKKN